MTVYKRQTKTSASEAFLASLNADHGAKTNPFLTEAGIATIATALAEIITRQVPVELTSADPAMDPLVWNVRANYNAYTTLTTNMTLSLTDLILGDYGTLKVYQGGTGSYTLTLPAGSKVGNTGGGAISLQATVGNYDIISFYYDELGVLNFNITNDFT